MAEAAMRTQSPKRQLDSLEEVSASKRRKVPYRRHHSIHHKQQHVPSNEPALVDPDTVQKLLVDSIKTVIEEEGLKQDVKDPLIESMALEAFRGAVEEFVLRLCSRIRLSMQTARRTVPIAPDFESAINTLNLPRPDDQLIAYRTKPHTNPTLYPTPPPEDSFHDNVELPTNFLGADLDGKTALKRFTFTTSALPPLPSAHTYKGTAVFAQRETDSRKIRELATEEGKLGEQALRKLAGAVKIDAAHPGEVESKKETPSKSHRGRRRRVDDTSEEADFESAVRALLQAEPEGFELGPIVNTEKPLRMPDDAQIKRRTKAEDGGQTATKTVAAVQAPRRATPTEEMEL